MKYPYGLRAGEKKTYHMGKHFKTYHVLSYVAVSIIVFGFYFIYDFLFVQNGLFVTGTQLLMIFIAIEVLLMYGIKKGGDWIKRVYYYELSDAGVTVVMNKNRTTYTWDKFQDVRMGMHSFVDLCPVQYTYDGKKLTFSQYLEDMYGMHLVILSRISDHVKIPEGLEDQLYSFAKD